MKYKSLLLDVDGTLVPVGPHTMPSQRVVDALRQAQKMVHVSLVSGRCLDWLTEIFQILDLTDPCIINGGSQIIDPKTKKILWERPIYKESVRKILALIKQDQMPFIVSDNGIEYENTYESEFLNTLAIKLSYFDSKEKSDQCLKTLSRIPDISAHKTFSWDKDRNYKMDIYITHKEATKHYAAEDRKSTRLNSSHSSIFYFFLFFLMMRRPPRSPLFPSTTLFRSTFSWDKDRNYKMDIYITHKEATKHYAA